MTVLPAEASRPWAELVVPAGLSNLPARPGLFVGRARELARLDAALATRWAAAHAADYLLTWWI